MSRGSSSVLETAVSESPLFRLPLELRTMIYENVLVQEGGISIPNDAFKRLKGTRESPRPAYCGSCTAVFSNRDIFSRHSCSAHDGRKFGDPDRAMLDEPGIPALPCICTSILRLCRLTHLEASPMLYRKNAFYFGVPTTARAFVWKADRTQATFIQEITFTLITPRFRNQNHPDAWLRYVTRRKDGLAQDFPHLKRMVINLKGWFRCESAARIRPVFLDISECVRGLDWVHVNGLNNEKLLEYLEPMVTRKNDSQLLQDRAQDNITEHAADCSWRPLPPLTHVRRNVTESTNALGWKNATLWWGTSEGSTPYERRPSEPSRCRERLFRLGSGEDDTYITGSSYL